MTADLTFITPIGIGFILLAGLLMFLLPRRLALLPVILVTCYMTIGQRIVIASLDFTLLRILILIGWARLIVRNELRPIRWTVIDKVLLAYVVSSVLTYTLLWQTAGALIYKLGGAYHAIGLYFLFRFLLRDIEDVKRAVRMLAIFVVPLAVLMLVEKVTGRNGFAVFGGVPEFTVAREGVLRCQGPFRHPILAGTFGATLLPLFVSLLWEHGRRRLLALIGFASSTVIVLTAASSGPVFAYLAGLLGLCVWPFRRYMRPALVGVLVALISLHLVMKAPVWALIGRVRVFYGSTGWHRYYVIDRAIAHLSEWWLIGTKSTAHWGPYVLQTTKQFDVTNQYVGEGIGGGLLTMILFISILVYGFKSVGRAVRLARDESLRVRLFVWGMGAALFAHAVGFISISYFDQNVVNWYLLLAMISTTCGVVQYAEQPGRVRKRIRSPEGLTGVKPSISGILAS